MIACQTKRKYSEKNQSFLLSIFLGMPEIDEDDLEAELDALGDDFALDDDTSYLDDATKAPDAPEKEPGADSVAVNQDGVMVDEFGLPKIPTNAQ